MTAFSYRSAILLFQFSFTIALLLYQGHDKRVHRAGFEPAT